MIIVHVITAFGIGGAEKLLLNIVNRQVKDHKVHLLYLKPIEDLLTKVDKSVVVKRIPISLTTIKKLSRYYKEVKADIIHTHLGHADFLGIFAAKKTSAKIFCTMHNIYFKKNWKDKIYFNLYRMLFLKVSQKPHVISVSKSVEKLVKEKFKIPKQRSHILYNAIPSIHNENKKISKEIMLLFIGRLTKAKSIETLLKSIKHLKDEKLQVAFELTIVGEGNLRNDLEQLTKKLQIEKGVKFVGKQKNVEHFYEQSDIFILPSIWEGFGIVILEAFRAKLAVIASNVEGPAELIKNNENGLLFEPKNHIELAKKIKLLIEDKNLRNRIANKGYETFTEDFHIDNYVKKLNKLYQMNFKIIV